VSTHSSPRPAAAPIAAAPTLARIDRCRSCGGRDLHPVLDLGVMPLADRLPRTPPDPATPEPRFPLEVACCPACSLVQLLHTVDPGTLFRDDYPYHSSFSDHLLAHAREHARELVVRRELGPDSLVVEIASNDGYLLRWFAEAGIPVLGVEPAEGPAASAESIGIPTRCDFFTERLAGSLADELGPADVVLASNVLAHVPDPDDLVAGIRRLLRPGGVAVLEFPYVRDLVEQCEFDTIYHEHMCYFSMTALDALFRRHHLVPADVRRIPIHGGSLRLTVAPGSPRAIGGSTVQALLAEERAEGIDRPEWLADFAGRVDELRARLRSLLDGLHADGRRVAGYGAAAKGAILLNAIGAGPQLVSFVVDRNVHKQGRWMPGVGIPIDAPERLLREQPDDVIILPWNFRDEIMAQQAEYRRRGGRFIVPVPTPRFA